jgi:hypothetical protein
MSRSFFLLPLLLIPAASAHGQTMPSGCSPDRGSLARLASDLGNVVVSGGPGGHRLFDVPVDVPATEARIGRLTAQYGSAISVRKIGNVGGFDLQRIDLPSAGPARTHVLITAGVHGNEPTGVATALDFVDRAMRDPSLRRGVAITVIPMVNPTGLAAYTRVNRDGADVNRSFAEGRWTPESRIVTSAIDGERFDAAIDLHGAQEDGFFLIRGADDGEVSSRILSALPRSELMGEAGETIGPYTLSMPGGATSDNPGTLKGWMTAHGTRFSYTMEYPRTLPPPKQLEEMGKLLRAAVGAATSRSS